MPEIMTVRPRVYSTYGALIGASLLGLLYLYRGRPFIVYWIAAWLLVAAAVSGRAPVADARLGGLMLSVGALLGFWAAGLFYLAPSAFMEQRVQWTGPLKVAALSAVWFVIAPFVLNIRAVLASGYIAVIAVVAAAVVRYFLLARRLGYIGAYVIAAGMLCIGLSNLGGLALLGNILIGPDEANTLLNLNVLMSIVLALGMHVVVFEDMTAELRRTNRDLESANEEVRRLAITDSLTGCYNRRFFDQIERREIQRHRRYSSPLSVVFVDVDRFKHLNDTRGHDTGDATLRAIGALLRSNIRESDYVIRWGGDEFVLLLTCGHAQAERKAAELKTSWARDPGAAELPKDVGLSIGVAEVPADAEDLSHTIKLADERMYRDKARMPA